MNGLFPWLRDLLFGERPEPPPAAHVCDEFTQWTACQGKTVIVADSSGKPLAEPYEINPIFQERRCTVCGKIQQQTLLFDSFFDGDEETEAGS